MTNWTETAFKSQYLEAEGLLFSQASTRAECDLIVGMARPSVDTAILDLACGHGRHTLELHRRGFRSLTGLDYSEEALEHARYAAATQSAQVDFVRGDMRALEFDARFDLVVNAYNSLFYWDDATHQMILKGIHKSLKPGGLLWLDVYNREFMVARSFLEEHPRSRHLLRLRLELGKLKQRVLNSFKRNEVTFGKTIERRFDPLTGVMRGVKRIVFSDGRRFDDPFEVRLYAFTELRALLESTGFEVLETRSCSDGGAYRLTSNRLAVLARKH